MAFDLVSRATVASAQWKSSWTIITQGPSAAHEVICPLMSNHVVELRSDVFSRGNKIISKDLEGEE
jgi:hypothetical protein